MATKKPTAKQQREGQRAAKLRAVQAQQARARRNRTITIVLVSVGAVAILAWPVYLTVRGDSAAPAAEGVQTFAPEAGHVTTPVTYEQDPPAGGPHDPAWLNCGVYSEAVRNENAVHAQEHGAVWVTYQPDLPAADVETLTNQLPDTYAILSPYPGLKSPVVVSAWGAQLALDGADDPRLTTFMRDYREGGLAPEAGAPCTEGVGANGQASAP